MNPFPVSLHIQSACDAHVAHVTADLRADNERLRKALQNIIATSKDEMWPHGRPSPRGIAVAALQPRQSERPGDETLPASALTKGFVREASNDKKDFILNILKKDYEHPWPNEDHNTELHRKLCLGSIIYALAPAAAHSSDPSALAAKPIYGVHWDAAQNRMISDAQHHKPTPSQTVHPSDAATRPSTVGAPDSLRDAVDSAEIASALAAKCTCGDELNLDCPLHSLKSYERAGTLVATPRTDAEEKKQHFSYGYLQTHVLADFARTLERESIALQADLDKALARLVTLKQSSNV